jgi:hypothetical protein
MFLSKVLLSIPHYANNTVCVNIFAREKNVFFCYNKMFNYHSLHFFLTSREMSLYFYRCTDDAINIIGNTSQEEKRSLIITPVLMQKF